MKKTFLLLAVAALTVACANAPQSNENFDTYEFDGFRLHVYNTGDAMGDASFIIEGKKGLVTLEQPLFKTNAAEFDEYLAGLKKKVAGRIVNFHLGNTGSDPVIMPEGMPGFVEGPVYGGMMKGFQAGFGDAIVDLPDGAAEEVAFGSTRTMAGVDFSFDKGPASDFPAASILIGGKVYATHWAPMKSHGEPLQYGSPAAIDAVLAECEEAAASGAELFIGSHGGAAGREVLDFKIGYLNKVKELLATCETADAFAEALTAAYPELPGAEGVAAWAEKLYE